MYCNMSIIRDRFPKYEDNSVTEIKDPNVAGCLNEHIKCLECRLAELQKTQHSWLVNNPTVVPDSDPNFRALRQEIKRTQLDLEISRRQQPTQRPLTIMEELMVQSDAQPVPDVPVATYQRQKSRFIKR